MMRALTWIKPGEVRIVDVPEPTIIQPDDAVVRVSTAALCGSDLHIYHGKVPKMRSGSVLGHEFCGEVVDVGPAVRHVKRGDRVLAAMNTACGHCEECLRGEHMLCGQAQIFGFGEMWGGLDGAQAEYVRVPMADTTLWPIPDSLDDEDVLFVGDILATAYTGCVAGNIRPGDVVAVVGAGPVGQLIAECAQLFGPAKVFAVDLVEQRLAQAAEVGAIGINAAAGDPAALMREHTGGARADVVIEAVGNAAALDTAWRLVRAGGRLSLVGFLTDEPFPVSAGKTWLRGLSIAMVTGQPLRYRPELIRLISAGRLNPRRIISHRYSSLDELPGAYLAMDRHEITKMIVTP